MRLRSEWCLLANEEMGVLSSWRLFFGDMRAEWKLKYIKDSNLPRRLLLLNAIVLTLGRKFSYFVRFVLVIFCSRTGRRPPASFKKVTRKFNWRSVLGETKKIVMIQNQTKPFSTIFESGVTSSVCLLFFGAWCCCCCCFRQLEYIQLLLPLDDVTWPIMQPGLYI